MSDIEQRLVAYGSLLPGGINHAQLGAAVTGQWLPCVVKAREGVIGPWRIITLDEEAPWVEAQLLVSEHLPSIWVSLDDFEGQAYKREKCTAHTADGAIEAYIYVESGLPLEAD